MSFRILVLTPNGSLPSAYLSWVSLQSSIIDFVGLFLLAVSLAAYWSCNSRLRRSSGVSPHSTWRAATGVIDIAALTYLRRHNVYGPINFGALCKSTYNLTTRPRLYGLGRQNVRCYVHRGAAAKMFHFSVTVITCFSLIFVFFLFSLFPFFPFILFPFFLFPPFFAAPPRVPPGANRPLCLPLGTPLLLLALKMCCSSQSSAFVTANKQQYGYTFPWLEAG